MKLNILIRDLVWKWATKKQTQGANPAIIKAEPLQIRQTGLYLANLPVNSGLQSRKRENI